MRHCFVNPAMPHFIGYPIRLASTVTYVSDPDGRLRPDLLPEDIEHAERIRSMFFFKDVEDGPAEQEAPKEKAEAEVDEVVLDSTGTDPVELPSEEAQAARAALSKILDAGAPKKSATRKKKT